MGMLVDVFYNENDGFVGAWLERLAERGHLPHGVVDTRSICDLEPADLRSFRQCHFFAGIGGWPYALALAGWPADREVWTGSCPCQPLSSAGLGRGHADERHLWPAFYRLLAERRPATIFGEQVASKDGREWMSGVRADLEALGYAVGAADLCAAGVGAPHIRQRLFWVAQSQVEQYDGRGYARRGWGELADGSAACGLGDAASEQVGRTGQPWQDSVWLPCLDGKARRIEPGSFPLADGVPAVLGRVRSDGMGEPEKITNVEDLRRVWEDLIAAEGRLPEEVLQSGVPVGASGEAARDAGSWPMASAEYVSEQILRGVWDGRREPPSPYRSQSDEQRAGQHQNTMQDMSCSGAPLGEILVGKQSRVTRLRGYGNAIVPQVAAEFVRAFMETE